METIMISTILVNICIGCFACVGLTTAFSMIQSTVMCLFKKQASIVMWSLPILKSYSLPIAQTASPFGSLTLPAENRFQKKFFLPWRMNLSSSGHSMQLLNASDFLVS